MGSGVPSSLWVRELEQVSTILKDSAEEQSLLDETHILLQPTERKELYRRKLYRRISFDGYELSTRTDPIFSLPKAKSSKSV